MQHHLEVEVREAWIGVAGGADVADDVAPSEPLTAGEVRLIAAQVGIVVDEAAAGIRGVDDEPAEPVALDRQHHAVVGREHGRAHGGEDVERVMPARAAVARRIEGVLDARRRDAGDRDHEPAIAQQTVRTVTMAGQRAASDQPGAEDETRPPDTTPHTTTHGHMIAQRGDSGTSYLTNKRSFG